MHATFAVIHHGKRRDRTRYDAQGLLQELGAAEREAFDRTERGSKRFEVDRLVLERDDEPEVSLLVA